MAKQARELDPHNEVVRAMQMTSKFAFRVREQESIKSMKEAGMYDAMTSVEWPRPPTTIAIPCCSPTRPSGSSCRGRAANGSRNSVPG
jgi:hypothetical protein